MIVSLNKTKATGFTLIELLVVISIIGLLASATLAQLARARDGAMYAVAKQDMRMISNGFVATDNVSIAIKDITGSGCSNCVCRVANGAPTVLSQATDASTCVTRWRTSITNIAAQTPLINDVESLIRDPWGSPYLLDENELEFVANPCRRDYLTTAGADRVWGTSDDFSIALPFRTIVCK